MTRFPFPPESVSSSAGNSRAEPRRTQRGVVSRLSSRNHNPTRTRPPTFPAIARRATTDRWMSGDVRDIASVTFYPLIAIFLCPPRPPRLASKYLPPYPAHPRHKFTYDASTLSFRPRPRSAVFTSSTCRSDTPPSGLDSMLTLTFRPPAATSLESTFV
jgi:hypothetical protein